MRHSLKTFLWNYFCQIPDPRTMDATSMTVHDCIRLIQQEKDRRWPPSQARAERQAGREPQR
jgi:hypothetical protein